GGRWICQSPARVGGCPVRMGKSESWRAGDLPIPRGRRELLGSALLLGSDWQIRTMTGGGFANPPRALGVARFGPPARFGLANPNHDGRDLPIPASVGSCSVWTGKSEP
ncbi:hypothetical protein QUF72_16370, partial [Desulfobacterales bacterium HSG2]|nr:hypothetical protein [Desulfobacterales bacterium HSG2]